MNIASTKHALAACLLGVGLLIAAPTANATPAPAHTGWCPFGHVNPADSNSACRGSDSSQWPESQPGPDGKPRLSCSRLNVTKGTRTWHGEHGWSYWICELFRDQFGNVRYEWTEVVPD